MTKRVVLIDGARTPFLRAGTDYFDLMSYQLGAFAIKGLIDRTGIDPNVVSNVIMGTVIHNLKTPNVAREAALTAGIPQHVPCHTVSQACISANQAIASAYELIANGRADVVIAGGTECTSDTPIVFRKGMRKKLFKAQKLNGLGDTLKFILSLRPMDFAPDRPAVAEFLTGKLMGEDCEMLAARFHATREEQDDIAHRSHVLADKATKDGTLAKEIVPVELAPNFKPISIDNGIRVAERDKLAKLKPAFVKPHGTITAANASFLTDGAAAVLLMTEDKAKELGLTPKARIVDYAFTGQDIREELLLGPAYAISKVLKDNGLDLGQMDVIELHEAFAGQVVANMKALASDEFARKKLGRDRAVGTVNMDRLNLWGGSLSIGHPFGATGARIMTTTANRLIAENGRYGILAACAAGAHGHAMVLERV
jgi:acetyl-CoA acetyltransferase family protein